MKIAILYPPKVSFQIPPYAPAIAVAVLREKGYNVDSMDINIEALHWLLSQESLEQSYTKAIGFYEKLNSSSQLNPCYFDIYKKAALSLSRKGDLFNRLGEAKQILRQPTLFYNAQRYKWAVELIESALSLHAVAHYPTRMLPNFRMQYSYQNVLSIKQAIEDFAENPFLPFCYKVSERFDKSFSLIAICVIHPSQVIPAFSLARIIKEQNPSLHLTFFGNLGDEYSITHLLDNPINEDIQILKRWIDSIIVYEAEETLCRLAEALEIGTPLNEVSPNLICLGDRISNLDKRKYQFQVLDELPPPDFEGLPLDLYLSPHLVLPYRLSRGCSYGRCTFCAIRTNHLGYRVKSPDKIVSDLHHLSKRYNTTKFHFPDELVTASLLEKVSLAIQSTGLKISWSFRTKPEKNLTPSVLKMAAHAGANEMWLGVESASQRTLRKMGKAANPTNFDNILKSAYDLKMAVHLLCIIGFPKETENDAYETFHFLQRNKGKFVSFSLNPFHLYQGSTVARKFKSFGVKIIDQPTTLTHRMRYNCTEGMSIRRKHELATQFTHALEGFQPRFFNYHVHRRLYNEQFGIEWNPKVKKINLSKKLNEVDYSQLSMTDSVEILQANFSLKKIDDYLSMTRFVTAYAEDELNEEIANIQEDFPSLKCQNGVIIYCGSTNRHIQLLSKACQRFFTLQNKLQSQDTLTEQNNGGSSHVDPFLRKMLDLKVIQINGVIK